MKHKIFLAEDGSALEVYPDAEGDGTPKKKRKRKKKAGEKEEGHGDGEEDSPKIPKKKKSAKVRKSRMSCIFSTPLLVLTFNSMYLSYFFEGVI